MIEEPQRPTELAGLLARIEAALVRGEAAADRLARRHQGLRSVARETLAGIDRLVEGERQRRAGRNG